jgi:serine protease Do
MDGKTTPKRLGLLLAGAIFLSGVAGFGGGIAAVSVSRAVQTEPSDITDITWGEGTAGQTGSVKTQPVGNTKPALTTAAGQSETLSIAEIAAQAAPSVVEITTESTVTGQRMQQVVVEGAGSGVIWSADGLIVTNNHVIEGASRITVRLADGTAYSAEVIGRDDQTDIALLRIDASGLTAASLGDSDDLVVGALAVAIGNPLGQLGGTVTDGIISALDRTITLEDDEMNLLQTNAAINPGNSGGGLFSGQAELIGIVVAKSSGSDIEGLGFAIPINDVVPVVDQLLQYGFVRGRIDLGLTLLDLVTEQAAMQYRVSRLGCYVLKVTSGSHADAAGFQSGDCILALADTSIATTADLNAALKQYVIGDTVSVTVLRNRQQLTLQLLLAEYQP